VKKYQIILSLAAILLFSSCDDGKPETQKLAYTPSSPPPPPLPSHNYDLKEGVVYSYIAAISEEDEKKGIGVGDVSMFKYLGNQDGRYTVASIGDDGKIIYTSSCTNPCVVIKNDTGRRTAYNPNSIIGAVFQDAISGQLIVSSSRKTSNIEASESLQGRENIQKITEIPMAFRGEWGDEPSACGTGLSDSRLVISAKLLAFYESDAEIKTVTKENARVISVTASSAGEGQVWESKMQLTLSRSGDDLTVNNEGVSSTRHRCRPS
jgi:hypothetical protein